MRPWLSAIVLLLAAGARPAAAQDWLPPGDGARIVAQSCNGCHDASRIRLGYTPDGWRTVMRMMQNAHAPVSDGDWDTVTRYLIANFPERPRPRAMIIDGPARISIKMWPVPTPGSRPHDPLATRDGTIWWTGQLANKLGRLDPRTGATREFDLTTPLTGPHGLVEDKAGNIWFTGNAAALIGKLEPATGKVTEYRTRGAKDPHTLLFARDGRLWFTVQQGNQLCVLDPADGNVTCVPSPTPASRPYGMALDSHGRIFFVEFGANKVASIDAMTLAIHEYPLPDPAARPRRIAITPDDQVWYTDYARGYIGRLDPRSGAMTEWPSPSGTRSEPYGIVAAKGAIWYSESGSKPNTIVRFDPASENFQSWALPGPLGGDIVRNMDVTPDGNPVMANSLANEIGLIEIE